MLPNWRLANEFFQNKLQTQVDNISQNIQLWEQKQQEALSKEQ